MRTCRSCGRESADDADFCACGEYLRWDPTNIIPAISPTAATATPDVSGPQTERSPAELDPNATLAPEAFVPGRAWTAPAGPEGLAPGIAPLPGAPGYGDAPPGAAAVLLRRGGDESASPGPITLSVQPGRRVTFLGLVRNQSQVVDNFDLSVRGLPDDWWTIAPATAYLVPYGTGGTFEQEIEIHLHPPRTPAAHARAWAFEVVAGSRAYGGEVASAPAEVTIEPFYDVSTELRPERASGRLKTRYRLTVRNKANARTEVELSADDADGECRFRWAEPRIALEPGNALECPFTVFPPKQRWIGRPLERRLQITAAPVGMDPPPPPRQAVFRQRAWLPGWLATVVALAVAAAVVVIKLLPKPVAVPNLAGLSVFAAQKAANKDGFRIATPPRVVISLHKPPGTIADQYPAAGTKKRPGTAITVRIYAGTGKVVVPSVVGLTAAPADQKLIAASLGMTISPQPPNPTAKIYLQLPPAGAPVHRGTSVAVFLPATTTGTTTTTTGTTTTGTTTTGTTTTGTTTTGTTTTGTTTTGTTTTGTTTTGTTTTGTTTTGTTTTGTTTTGTTTTGTTTTGTTTTTTRTTAPGGLTLAEVASEAGKGPISIPMVSGNATAASAQLSQLGLTPYPVDRLATVPIGDVAGTIPASGSKVAKGAQVDVLISTGSPELSYDTGTAVRVIDPITGKRAGVVPLNGPGPQVEASWSPDGTKLIVSQDGQLVVLEPNAKAAPLALPPPPTGAVDRNPSFAPTPTALVVAFIQLTSAGSSLCFATIGQAAFVPSCTTDPGWELGGEVDWARNGKTVLVFGVEDNSDNFGIISFHSAVPFSTQASSWGTGRLRTADTVAGEGVFAAEYSPNGKQMALVSDQGSDDFNLYIVPAGDFSPTPSQELPVRACQVAWRSDGQELAVMQPEGACETTARGTIIALNPADPRSVSILATNGAHPAWQPAAGS